MNEKLQYAEMLDIPVSTCNITYKPPKRRLFKKPKVNHEQVKKDLVAKVNDSLEETQTEETATSSLVEVEPVSEQVSEQDYAYAIGEDQPTDELGTELEEEKEPVIESSVSVREMEKPKKKAFKFSVITLQIAIIGVLLTTILITNALVPSSGINTFINGVFGAGNSVQEDNRVYSDFEPELPVVEDIVLQDGVMTFSAKGSLYSPCDGTVTAKTLAENGKYTLEITHNKNFKSVLTGIDYAYFDIGQEVLSNIPVGYALGEQVSLCFCGSDGNIITDYTIAEDSVIWSV